MRPANPPLSRRRAVVAAPIAGCLLAEAARAQAPAAVLPTGLGPAVDHDVVLARAATERFHDVKAALAEGYLATETCVSHPMHGAMGLHYKNPALRDGVTDPEHPEILLYIRAPDGGLKLLGAEYVVPLAAWKGAEPPRVFGQVMKRDDGLGIWDLHAWLWEPNPAGIFADWNPQVKC